MDAMQADGGTLESRIGSPRIDRGTLEGELALRRLMLGFVLASLVVLLFRIVTHR